MNQVRIDKYLWAIRLFKTRSIATTACSAGKVKVNGQSVKPAYQLKVGTIFSARKNHQVYIIEATKLIDKRVGAKIAAECFKDHTPEEEKKKMEKAVFYKNEKRERGTGRPTKKERRDIQDYKADDLDEWEDWD